MQENQYNNFPPQYDEQEEGIDIMEYVTKLWGKRWLIIKWCCVGAVVGLVVGFSLPKTYWAGAVLAPEIEQRMGSGVSSIASMMGVNVSNSIDAINAEMFPDVVHSTPFIADLFDLPVQFERKDSLISTDLLTYMLEYQKSPWWSAILGAPGKAISWCISLILPEEEIDSLSIGPRDPVRLTKKERDVVKYFTEVIQINVDKKTYKTELSMKMQDPLVVYTVMQAVLDNLKAYMVEYRTSKVSQDVKNLSVINEQRKAEYYEAQQVYAQYLDANKNVVLYSQEAERSRLKSEMDLAFQVYSQVATQLEAARIREQQAKPVYAVLEPAVVPIRKAGPSKAKLLIVFTFLAGCGAAAWTLFGNDVMAKIKEVTSEK